MKKIIRTVCIAAISLFAIPQQADAQFFKKLKEAAKGVVQEVTGTTTTGTASTTTTAQNAPSVSYLPSASGVLVAIPDQSISRWSLLRPRAARAPTVLTFMLR